MLPLQAVQIQNAGTPLLVRVIENRGDGVFVVKVHVPPKSMKLLELIVKMVDNCLGKF